MSLELSKPSVISLTKEPISPGTEISSEALSEFNANKISVISRVKKSLYAYTAANFLTGALAVISAATIAYALAFSGTSKTPELWVSTASLEVPVTIQVTEVVAKPTTKVSTPQVVPVLPTSGAHKVANPEFTEITSIVQQWTNGILPKTLGLMMLLFGLAAGVAKGNPLPAITGIAGSAFLAYGPSIILGVMGPPVETSSAYSQSSPSAVISAQDAKETIVKSKSITVPISQNVYSCVILQETTCSLDPQAVTAVRDYFKTNKNISEFYAAMSSNDFLTYNTHISAVNEDTGAKVPMAKLALLKERAQHEKDRISAIKEASVAPYVTLLFAFSIFFAISFRGRRQKQMLLESIQSIKMVK